MTATDRIEAPRFVLYTVGLDGPGEEQPTLFTRKVEMGESGTEATFPRLSSIGANLLDCCFSLVEARILNDYLTEESLHGFSSVLPYPVWTETDAKAHSPADEDAWIEVEFSNLEDGGEAFTAIGTSLTVTPLSKALVYLGRGDVTNCDIDVRLREEIQAPSA